MGNSVTGHNENFKNGTCGLSSLLLSVDGWTQGNGSCAVVRHHSAAFAAKTAVWPTAQLKRRWAPQTSCETPKEVEKPRKKETELI